MITSSIIEGIKSGSLKDFEVFFNHYYLKVRNFANGMVKNLDEAENIAQNVFMKIWLGRKTLLPDKSFDSYVFTIARNEVYDSFRNSLYSLNYREFAKGRISEEDGGDIESEYNIKEIKRIVDETVAAMPEQRKLIFRMSRNAYLSNEEIANRLGISKRTVEKHISLALSSIRKNLGDFFFWLFIFFIS